MRPETNHFPVANFTFFDINVADIWLFQINHYKEECYDQAYKLYEYLKKYLLSVAVKPFLSPETVKSGKHGQDYYDNYRKVRLLKRENKSLLNFFEHNGAFYDLLAPFVVTLENSSAYDFLHLFSLKLEQYKYGLVYIKQFLDYHLAESFKKDRQLFTHFLKLLLAQYKPALDENIISEINEFLSELVIDEHVFEGEVPKRYEVIDGEMKPQEIEFFFSFLYQEQSEGGKPWLDKKHVQEIFRYGLALPPANIKVKSYKLNCSKNFPKWIVEHCIYQFYFKFATTSKTKRKILRFFATYIDDFARALKTKKGMDNWSKNLTGDKAGKQIPFTLDDYMPKKFS